MTKHEKQNTRSLLLDYIVKFFYLILFLGLITIFYFVTLISLEPKSFPTITQKIESYTNQELAKRGASISLKKSYIGLEKLYKINIILYDTELKLDGKKPPLVIPKINVQFSLFHLITKLKPSKITVENFDLDLQKDNIFQTKDPKPNLNDDKLKSKIIEIWQFFLTLQNQELPTREFELKNVNISFKDQNNNPHKISIKYSDIIIDKNSEELQIIAKNNFGLNDSKENDTKLDISCIFDHKVSLKCKIDTDNFKPKKFAKLAGKIDILSQISATIKGGILLEINKDYEIDSIIIKAFSQGGNFEYKSLFNNKIDFQNLEIEAEITNFLKDLKIKKLNTIFDKDTKFAMTANITNVGNHNLEDASMSFNISNLKGNDIAKFWPVFLSPDIKDWIENHISEGVVRDGYANIKLRQRKNTTIVDKVESELTFSKINLNYSDLFPEITKIDGIASFTKDSMNINLISGDVLNSKIKLAKVTIDNFHSPSHLLLKINGSFSGKGSDPLRYIDYKSDFSKEIDKYINGSSDTTFNVQIPLKPDLELDDIYIKVISEIKNINSKYFKDNSNLQISTIKDFNDDNFKTFADLSSSNVVIDEVNLKKEKNTPSRINLDISFKDSLLYLDKIKWLIKDNYINSDLLFNLKPFGLLKAKLQTNLDNKYNFSYETNSNNSFYNINIDGDYINLPPILKSLSENKNNQSKSAISNIIVRANIKKVDLNSGQYLNNLKVNINCIKGVCGEGFIKSEMKNNNYIDIAIKRGNANKANIKGQISDISLLARGFGISDQIIGGKTVIKGDIESNGGKIASLDGNLYIKNDFSIIKNEIFDKIVNDKAFEKLRDEIKNSDKINFNKLDLDFALNEKRFQINKLIASSYLIGITAKGEINFENSQTRIKGLIIPGYQLNSLFGIGNIPVIGSIIMGEEGGGLFAIKYQYKKDKNEKGVFDVNAASVVIPGSIRNILQLFDQF